jgi:phosphoribosylanthranilate isomerase
VTRVKVCGITRPEDAVLAAEAGAAAIGMILWPGSPRAVTTDQARAIVAALPPLVQAVGVFVNAPPVDVARAAAAIGLDLVQLHGDEQADQWRGFEWPIVRATSLETAGGDAWDGIARAWLLDAHDPRRRGGTGRTIDWDAAAGVARRRAVILAGGLTADNVAQAIARVRPAAVDVSSGVERAPGIKEAARLRAFVAAVRQADAQGASTPSREESA